MSFLPGETGGVKRCFNITVLDDVILEDVEYFTLMIQPSSADDSESSVQVGVLKLLLILFHAVHVHVLSASMQQYLKFYFNEYCQEVTIRCHGSINLNCDSNEC